MLPMPPLPELPLPEPYRCCDPGSFARNTLLVRLPDIASRVLKENRFPAAVGDRMESLLAEMREGSVQPLRDPGAPDESAWKMQMEPSLGRSWQELSFLVCENIFYRRILEVTGYFQPGLEYMLDPYYEQKQLGLATSQEAILGLARRLLAWQNREDLDTVLEEMLETNLWSNRADLSLWPAGAEGTLANDQLHQAEEFLLANDSPGLSRLIAGMKGTRVDFLIDNAGFELVGDLALADFLLARGLANKTRFHLKFHPTFVSDALPEDVRTTAAYLAAFDDPAVRDFGARLIGHLADGSLELQASQFWNSPLSGWELPDDLRQNLAGADLVISKGDANFRRLIGDLRWEETVSFAQVAAYFPTHLAALRVIKSEAVLGLPPGKVDWVLRKDPDWRADGRWGVILFK